MRMHLFLIYFIVWLWARTTLKIIFAISKNLQVLLKTAWMMKIVPWRMYTGFLSLNFLLHRRADIFWSLLVRNFYNFHAAVSSENVYRDNAEMLKKCIEYKVDYIYIDESSGAFSSATSIISMRQYLPSLFIYSATASEKYFSFIFPTHKTVIFNIILEVRLDCQKKCLQEQMRKLVFRKWLFRISWCA